jgi:hypothetical protein
VFTCILSILCTLLLWVMALRKLAPFGNWFDVAKRNFGKWVLIWGLFSPETFDDASNLLLDVKVLGIASSFRALVRWWFSPGHFLICKNELGGFDRVPVGPTYSVFPGTFGYGQHNWFHGRSFGNFYTAFQLFVALAEVCVTQVLQIVLTVCFMKWSQRVQLGPPASTGVVHVAYYC